MRHVFVVFLLAGALALATFVPRGTTAPSLADKPPRYEYAELQYARTFERGPGQGGPVIMPAPLPAGPGGALGMPPPDGLKTTIRWSTAEEQVEVKEWSELADKLKAPEPKKESPATVHKLRVLNRLSELGWEVLDRPLLDASGAMTVGFRRKVP